MLGRIADVLTWSGGFTDVVLLFRQRAGLIAMPLRLSDVELAGIERANTILLSPFAYENGEAWRCAAARAVEDCLGGHASSFALPIAGERLIAATPDVQRSLDAVDPPPDWVVHGLTVRRRELGLTVTNWDELFEGNQVRRTSFYNEIVRPQGLMAPVVMLTDSGVSLIPAALSVYFNDEKYADRSVQHRKAILRLLYPAFRSAIRTYVDHRKNLEALRALGELAPIGVMWFDARGRGAHENEFFRRLMESDSERDRVRSEAANLARGIIYGPLHSSSSERTSSEVHTKRGHYRMAATFIQDHTAPGPAIAVVVVERVEGRAMAARRLVEVYSFTRREIEIAELLRTGLSTKEIAAALGISVNTARRHLERIYLKLDVHTRASAAARLLDN